MAAVFWTMGLSLLLQGCLWSVGQTDTGCIRWTASGTDVCCQACHPGNRLVKDCGPRPKELCTPCERGAFVEKPNMCTTCTRCLGALVEVEKCTTTTDTKCGCKEGLTCGDDRCSFCVDKCDKGQEPTEKRSCRPCPDGTFNDQVHQMCKPWSTKCPNPAEHIVAGGNALTDITCGVSLRPAKSPKRPDPTEEAWPFVLSMVTSLLLTSFGTVVIITIIIISRRRSRIMAKKALQKMEEEEEEKGKAIPRTLIIDSPTDDPRTLIAIECSFHEAEQEQGSSSESLASDDSAERLIA
ncbi:tumor necrosis factor receptor superfamily member 9a [Gasterosteus aculeatus]